MEEQNVKKDKFDWETSKKEQLVRAFLLVSNTGEARAFLRDLMTEKEIEEFANRLEAARLLNNNTQYVGIIEKTGLSSTTIARISKWLRGPLGGYKLVLNKLHNTHSQYLVGKGLSLH